MSEIPLKQWLQQVCPFPIDAVHAMQGDASFRHYYRLLSGQQSYVVMDASRQRDCFEPFVAIARALHLLGLAVPHIVAHDVELGFMLITDLGDKQYLNTLTAENADVLYKTALNALSRIQACRAVSGWPLPAFDHEFMQRELAEFDHWFLDRYLQLSRTAEINKMLQATYNTLTVAASLQPQVFIHRDYHSANLMVTPSAVGILDFQDACIGPITYDLVSLLRDCYIDWPIEQIQHWVAYYYETLRVLGLLVDVSLSQFMQWFDWMGMQRHMKALFIFSRKYCRDHTDRYLQFLPRTLNYLVKVSGQYPEFKEFHAYIRELELPTILSPLTQCSSVGEG